VLELRTLLAGHSNGTRPELRELLTGNDEEWPSEPEDGIAAQIKFVEEHWLTILEAFGSDKREQTHTDLKVLAEQRAKRRWG
jgi:hypothetical protein